MERMNNVGKELIVLKKKLESIQNAFKEDSDKVNEEVNKE